MFFKKPIDRYEGLSKREVEEKMDEFSKNDFDKDDEKAMIFAAIKTIMPAVILVCIVFGILVVLIAKLFRIY